MRITLSILFLIFLICLKVTESQNSTRNVNGGDLQYGLGAKTRNIRQASARRKPKLTSAERRLKFIIRLSMRSFLRRGKVPKYAQNIKFDGKGSSLKKGLQPKHLSDKSRNTLCFVCSVVMDEMWKYYHKQKPGKELYFDRILTLCEQFGTTEFCVDAIYKQKPLIMYLHENADTDGNDTCGMLLMEFGCTSSHPKREWEIKLSDVSKPEIENVVYPKISEISTSKILLLSDFHYDRLYAPGSNAECTDVNICCRSDSKGNRTAGDEAGYWGDYRSCDLPKWTLDLLIKDAAERHPDTEFIFWLGDHMVHNVLSVSRQEVIETINETFTIITKYFPNTMVFPAIGNHDVDTVNLFAPPYIEDPELNTAWLYDELATIWMQWLPQNVTNTVAYAGFYATNIKPRLRIISINSNYCLGKNWWIILDSKDLGGNLDFLAKELQKSENAGEKTYVLSHIPSGSRECDPTWSREFNKIINRYENTVVGIYNGHEHNDYFEIYFDKENNNRPYQVGYVVPSQTSYVGLNPGYAIQIAEGNYIGTNFRILDHESYILDLEEANTHSNTTVTMLYSALGEYQLSDMSPKSMLNLVECMNTSDSSLFAKFYRNVHKNGSNARESCDNKCKQAILCAVLHTDNSDVSECRELNKREQCDENCFNNCNVEIVSKDNTTIGQNPEAKNDMNKTKESSGSEPSPKLLTVTTIITEETTDTTKIAQDTTPTTKLPEETTDATIITKETTDTTKIPKETTPTIKLPEETTGTTKIPKEITLTTEIPEITKDTSFETDTTELIVEPIEDTTSSSVDVKEVTTESKDEIKKNQSEIKDTNESIKNINSNQTERENTKDSTEDGQTSATTQLPLIKPDAKVDKNETSSNANGIATVTEKVIFMKIIITACILLLM